jgi:hypothetical protein
VGRGLVAFAASAALVVLGAGACSSGGDTTSRTSSTSPSASPTSAVPSDTRVATTSVPPPATLAQRREPALPVAVQEAAATTVGTRLFVVGGYDRARDSRAATWAFDGSAWTAGPALPLAVNHPGAATIGTDVYVAGGFTAAGATNRVFVLASGAARWRDVAPMHRARGALALVAIGGRLYAIGGRDNSAQIGVPERYDPRTDSWTDVPSMPEPRNHLAGFVDGVSVCVAGGRTPETSSAVDCLDTRTGEWRASAGLPIPTSGAAAGIVDRMTIVAGGEPSGETRITDVVQMFAAHRWTTAPMLVPRHGTAFARYRGRLWMCGGATAPGFHAVADCTSIGP